MKTMIVVWVSKDRGKTHGIKAAAFSFPFTSFVHRWKVEENGEYAYDSYVIGHYTTETGRDTIVGMESLGDPGSEQGEWIQKCIDAECEVIVCACRTWGNTRDYVNNAAKNNGYELIEVTTPYHEGDIILNNGTDLSAVFANFVNELIVSCLK